MTCVVLLYSRGELFVKIQLYWDRPFKLSIWNSPQCPQTLYKHTQLICVFADEPRRMLRIIQHFGKHCTSQLQGDALVGFTLKMADEKFVETGNFSTFDAAHPRTMVLNVYTM